MSNKIDSWKAAQFLDIPKTADMTQPLERLLSRYLLALPAPVQS